MIIKERYRVEETCTKKGEIKWVDTVKVFETLEEAREYVSTNVTVPNEPDEECYFVIWKITTVTTTETKEEPIE